MANQLKKAWVILPITLVSVLVGALLASCVQINNPGPSTPPIGGAEPTYDRSAAYNYAKKYYDKVCSDGYFWTSDSKPTPYPAESPVPTAIGDDCAHFVSSAIGNEPHESGGGLPITSRWGGGVYGDPGAGSLVELLLKDFAVEKNSINDLEKGDIVGYRTVKGGDVVHVALYLGDGKVAAHSASHWNEPWQLQSIDWRYIHIIK